MRRRPRSTSCVRGTCTPMRRARSAPSRKCSTIWCARFSLTPISKGRSVNLSRWAAVTIPLALFPVPRLFGQKHAITIDSYLALKNVGDPQLSPDGKWVAYTIGTVSLQDNRSITRIWLAELATGQTRAPREGPGSDPGPLWGAAGKALAFISSRQGGPQIWVLSLAGGEAQKVSSLPDGVNEFVWTPDGNGFVVVNDIKWPTDQEIDHRNGELPTDASIWTNSLGRDWDEMRVGKRQHLFAVDRASGRALDLSPVDHDVPGIATSGDGDFAVAPDGKQIAVAFHGDDVVADNTNVDVYVMNADGSGLHAVTAANKGADNTPRYSPDGKWLSYLSMARPGFEADRQRLMLLPRAGGAAIEVTAGWTPSVRSFGPGPHSACGYAGVGERGAGQLDRVG